MPRGNVAFITGSSAESVGGNSACELGSGSTGGFPPTFTITSPGSGEGEVMAKAGGKVGVKADTNQMTSFDFRFFRIILWRSNGRRFVLAMNIAS
jgi:hypothetical protein